MPPKRTPVKTQNSAVDDNEDAGDEDIDALIHLREMAQAKVARIKSVLPNAESEEIHLTLPQVKMYTKKLEAAYTEFTTNHQRIVENIAASKRKKHDQCYLRFEELHDEVSIALETIFEEISKPAVASPPSQTIVNQQPLIVQQPLPRVIPTFDGKYEHWERFKIMFRDVVDQSNEPSRIKLYHLEKALIGDAADIIDAKTISDGNYDRAWQLLEERYEDKRRIVHLHIGGLINVKKLSRENYNELRMLVESFISHVENLKFLGQEITGVSEQILVYLLAGALDDETKIFGSQLSSRECCLLTMKPYPS